MHEGPNGLKYTVTADGLSHIDLAGRTLATGGWYAWNAGPVWFGAGSRDVLAYGHYSQAVYAALVKDITSKTLETLGEGQARVRHEQPHVTAVYDYTFAGEDVTIAARIENRHPSATLAMPAMGGLRFTFARPPDGHMVVWHTSYLRHIGKAAFHPSHANRIGGSYAVDGAAGVGATPIETGLARTLLFWDYDGWAADQRQAVPVRWLTYVRAQPIPAGGAMTFKVRLRASTRTDWQHLLAPYKAHFLATFGPVRYKADHRAMVVAHVNRNVEAIGPDNPYGFHGGFRRLDLPDQVKAFCDRVVPGLQAAGGQGVIIWGQTGEERRREMYRTDFDVIPPEVEANWPTLVKRFGDAGLAVGVCTRPGQVTYRLTWTRDGTMPISADEPAHLEMMWRRFDRMIRLGCTRFYLDSFGAHFGDVRIMQYLREKMGPDILTYAEHQCDAVLPYSGVYTETDFWAAGSADWAKEDRYRPRSGLWFLEVGRWLLGEDNVPVISRLYDRHGKVPEGFEDVRAFFYRNRMTPMIADYRVGEEAEAVRALQAKYLSADRRHWKPSGRKE